MKIKWLIVIILVIVTIGLAIGGYDYFTNRPDYSFIDNEYLIDPSNKEVTSGYFSVSQDGYLHTVVRLTRIYQDNGLVLADIQWAGENPGKTTVILSDSQSASNFSLVKQTSKQIFPNSTDISFQNINSQGIQQELNAYIGHNVIMGFFIAEQSQPENLDTSLKSYLKHLETYISCNKSLLNRLESVKSRVTCRPFSHVTYVIQK